MVCANDCGVYLAIRSTWGPQAPNRIAAARRRCRLPPPSFAAPSLPAPSSPAAMADSDDDWGDGDIDNAELLAEADKMVSMYGKASKDRLLEARLHQPCCCPPHLHGTRR